MPVGWCESITFERLRKWKQDVSKVTPYLWPVFISLLVTQIIWAGVYECKDKGNFVRHIRYIFGEESLVRRLNDSNSLATWLKVDMDFHDPNPKTLGDLTIETLLLVPILGLMVVIPLAMIYISSKCTKACEQVVQVEQANGRQNDQEIHAYIAIFFAFYGSNALAVDATDLLDIDLYWKKWIFAFCSIAYICGIIFAFCTNNICPEGVFLFFLVANCVFQSLFFLTILPADSFWIIIAALFLFVGLSRCISAKMGKGPDRELQQPYPAETIYTYVGKFFNQYVTYKVFPPEEDDTLGQIWKAPQSSYPIGEIFYYELVLYGILVGQSMASGIIPGIVSACGVLIGVAYSAKSRRDRLRLPPPHTVIFGFCGHFVALTVQYAVIFLLKTTANQSNQSIIDEIIDRLK